MGWFTRDDKDDSKETALNDGTPVTKIGTDDKGQTYVWDEVDEKVRKVDKEDIAESEPKKKGWW